MNTGKWVFVVAGLFPMAAFVAAQPPRAGVQMSPDGRVKMVVSERTHDVPPASDEEVLRAIGTAGAPPAAVASVVSAKSGPVPTRTSPGNTGPEPEAPIARVVQPSDPSAPLPNNPASPGRTVAVNLAGLGTRAVLADEPLGKLPEKPQIPERGIITVEPKKNKPGSDQKDQPVTVSAPNPFDVRFVPVASLDEYVFTETGGLWGSNPVVYINSSTLSSGSSINGFKVHKIRTDGVILEKDGNYFFLPAGEKVTIRLPK